MAVLDEVREALVGCVAPAWKQELALSLAEAMDKSPNASSAKELQVLMADLVGVAVEKRGDVSDDLAAKRAARRSAAG